MVFSKNNIRIFNWLDALPEGYQSHLKYDGINQIPEIQDSVKKILSDIKIRGNKACVEYTEKFDKVTLDENELVLLTASLDDDNSINETFKQYIADAIQNITEFHSKQLPRDFQIEKECSSFLSERWLPLDSVGCYIPGGSAPLVSTVMMTVIPAKIAGVKNIFLATPPDKEGNINPYILYTAKLLGVKVILKLGGIQAIGALAYGIKGLNPVQKVVGPGNSWVTEAKRQIFGNTDIDMLAGPSEVTVICDDQSDPDFVAADVLSQLEHDPYSCASIITTAPGMVDDIINALNSNSAPLDRIDIIRQSLKNLKIIIVENIDSALHVADIIAPEHLEVMTELTEKIKNYPYKAGAVFLGNYTPVAVGDFFGGTNHVLPTEGKAAFSSPLGVIDFMRRFQIACYSEDQIKKQAEKINFLADIEGLKAHGNSALIRANKG